MGGDAIRLLLLEDNPGDAGLVQAELAAHAPGEFTCVVIERLADALARIKTSRFDAMLCDLTLPDSVGVDTARAVVAQAPTLPLVVLTGSHDEPLGNEAIRNGAQDYLNKDGVNGALLARALRYAIERKRMDIGLRAANEALERRVLERTTELETALAELSASEVRFRELAELTADWYWEQDEQFRFTWFSEGAMVRVGADVAEYLGKTRRELPIDGVSEEQWAEHTRSLQAHLPFRDFQYRWTNRDGSQHYLNISGRPVIDRQGRFRGYHGVGSDISRRRQAELDLLRQKELYAVLSQSNQAIVRCTDRDQLFGEVCRIAVEYGGFRSAWIGVIDPESEQVRPAARYGEDAGYPDQMHVSIDAAADPGPGIVVPVLRTGTRCVSNDFLEDSRTGPWHAAARSSGVRSCAVLPIRQGGAVVGAFGLYAGEPGYFNEGYLATLDEVAQDVSFALDNFEREAERVRAERELRASEEQLDTIFNGTLDGILVADAQTKRIVAANSAICAMLGYTRAQLLDMSIAQIHPAQDLARATEPFARLARGEIEIAEDIPMLRRDGSVFGADIKAAPIRFDGRDCLAGVFRDNTERKRAQQALARQRDLFNALSQTNHAIGRCASREELFRSVCRVAVEHGRFRFAWIGLVDAQSKRVIPMAQFGDDGGYVKELDISVDASVPSGSGRSGRALRTGEYAVMNDFADERARPASRNLDGARRSGAHAYATFPIRQAGAVVGAINFYATEPGFFTNDLVATLEQIAQDLSFALDGFEREAARDSAVRALAESEARYRSVFANSNVAMLLIDPADGRVADANGAACSYYGWASSRFRGMRMNEINVADRCQTAAQTQRIRAGEKGRYEFRHRLADGRVRDVEAFIGPIEVGGRRLVLSIIHDISERLQAATELTESEERFRGLVEQSIAGIYMIQDGCFAYVNPRFAEIFGYATPAELIGRTASSVIVEGERQKVVDVVRSKRDSRDKGINYEFTGLRKDGTTVEIGAHGARAPHGGRPAIIGLIEDISEKKRAEEQIRRYVAQLESALRHTVDVATTLSEMRDPYTAGHERRVAAIAVAIGKELGLDTTQLEGLRVAGHLHDIGKITIPSEILAKPGRLTPLEYELIKHHPQASYDVLKKVAFPWPIAEAVLQHHERLDGSGYPQGLNGDAIRFEARILAVADVVEAMASHRPYRAGFGTAAALAEIERGRGTVYDPRAVDACLRLFREKGYSIPDVRGGLA